MFINHFQYPTVKRLPSPLEPQDPGVHQRLLPQRKSYSVPSRKMWKSCEQIWKCDFLISLYIFWSRDAQGMRSTTVLQPRGRSKSKKANVFHHMKDPKIRTPKEATEATEAPCGNPRPGASHCDHATWSTKPIEAHRPWKPRRLRRFRRSHPSAHPYKS